MAGTKAKGFDIAKFKLNHPKFPIFTVTAYYSPEGRKNLLCNFTMYGFNIHIDHNPKNPFHSGINEIPAKLFHEERYFKVPSFKVFGCICYVKMKAVDKFSPMTRFEFVSYEVAVGI